MQSTMNRVVAKSDSTLTKYGPESPLGNFAADLVMNYYLKNKDKFHSEKGAGLPVFCLLNFGGLRTPINRGEITVGNVFEFMPFDNTIVFLEVDRKSIDSMLVYMREQDGQPISNAKMVLRGSQNELWIEGEKYGGESSVMIVTSNYLAGGGDNMRFLLNPLKRYDSGILLRDVYLQEIEEMKIVPFFPVEGRIMIE